MCTVVLLVRPGHAWPLLLAANRDERLDREWDAPATWWPGRPALFAGRDRLGFGTWMALENGVAAAVLNRPGSLGPAPGKLSRGDLPLLAVGHGTAERGIRAIAALDAGRYRSFNLVVADHATAWFARGLGNGRPEVQRVRPGLHVMTAHDPDDPASPRGAALRPRFAAAPAPDPAASGWASWQAIVADRSPPGLAMNVAPQAGFGTVCSSLLALPESGPPTWLFAAGPPDAAPFHPVSLP